MFAGNPIKTGKRLVYLNWDLIKFVISFSFGYVAFAKIGFDTVFYFF